MKLRRGFVTNSSSTNDIFQALGTAGAAAALGTIINTIQVSEHIEIVSYAILETSHHPQEPRPPQIRVNDSDYAVWYYAAVRMIDVQYAFDEESGETTITVLRDEYDQSLSSQIKYSIPSTYIEKWLTFGGTGSELAFMDGDYKVCGFICESWENDKPRKHRQGISGMMQFDVSVDIAGKTLYKARQTNIKDESDLYAYSGIALNDSKVTTHLPIKLLNPDKYKWAVRYETVSNELEDYARLSLEQDIETSDALTQQYFLSIKPLGRNLTTQDKPRHSIVSRVEIKGKPNATHIPEVWDYLEVTLIDEGLIFEGKCDSEANLEVISYAVETVDEHASKTEIAPTAFRLRCVVRTDSNEGANTAEFINMWEAKITFKELKGSDEATRNLVQAYEYEITPQGSTGNYVFEPQMQIPAGTSPYRVFLPISCEYQGKIYELDLPIQLIGEPFGHKQAWEEEYRKLRIIIRRYIPPEQWIDILKNIEEHRHRLSIEQLRLMRRSIYETARDKLVAEAEGYQTITSICEWTEWGLEGVKWMGDQAFSYLMAVYTGPIGEAFIVPFKDVLTMVVADELTTFIWGGQGAYTEEQIARGALSGIFTAFENAINIGADDMVGANKLSVRQLGRYLAAFAVVKCMNHYFTSVKEDGSPIGFWDAIVETCKDLSVNFFKNIVGKKFESMMKSDKAGEIFEKYVSKQFKEQLLKTIPDWDKIGISDPRSLEILGKYLSEFAGFVSASAYGKVISVAGTSDVVTDPNDTIISFNLSSDAQNPYIIKVSLNKVKDKLIDYMFYSLFGQFPFAPAPIQTTDDPKFYKF